jgi:hypothetical protein
MVGWIAWLFIAVTWLELIFHFDEDNNRLKNLILIFHIIVVGVVAGLICYYIYIFTQSQISNNSRQTDTNNGLFNK